MELMRCLNPEVMATADRTYTAAPVLPEHGLNTPRYIGAIQWVTGPNMTMIDSPKIRTAMLTLTPKGSKESFYFRIFWHGEEMDSFTQRGIDNAILKSFKTLCANHKVQLAFDEPFKKDLDDPKQIERIIRTFEQAFINLDNAPREN